MCKGYTYNPVNKDTESLRNVFYYSTVPLHSQWEWNWPSSHYHITQTDLSDVIFCLSDSILFMYRRSELETNVEIFHSDTVRFFF